MPSGSGSCSTGRKAYYCELGQVWADGEVSCYFEVPDYCDVFPCAPGFQTWPQANGMCCCLPRDEVSRCFGAAPMIAGGGAQRG